MGSEIIIDPAYLNLFEKLGLDAGTIFSDPRICVWRSLPDRENATLDFQSPEGHASRLHIKRYPPSAGSMAVRELRGYRLLKEAGVPAAPVIASGHRSDGSSFIVLEDLAGYTPADKLIERGFEFDKLLIATADLAALLHNCKLHHRDLYLCHFMVKPVSESVDAKLIDMARVDQMRSMLTRRRWIIKDLAQFWYSTRSLHVTDEQRRTWLDRYCERREIAARRLIRSIERKALVIARHDVQLHRQQPSRNISISEMPTK